MSILGQLLVGWLLADLLTGIFHWWEDTHQHLANVPVIGSYIIAPNILHHEDPVAFTKHGFWARNLASIIAACAAAAVLTWLFGLQAWIVAMAVGGGLSNEVHRYAHEPRKAHTVLKVMQEIGIIQSPKAHALHHRPPHERNFFILTDWLNPVFEALDVWNRAGRLLRK